MSRKQSPLFELINKTDTKARRGFALPAWMKPPGAETEAPEPPEGAEAAAAQRESFSSTSPVEAQPEPAPLRAKSEPVTQVQSWLRQPTLLRLPRGGLLLLVGTLVAVVMIAFWAGRSVGEATASQEMLEYTQAVNALGPIQEQTINPELIPPTVEGVGRPTVAGSDGVVNGGRVPSGELRQPGLNYFVLVSVPSQNREELEKAVAFLAGEGVDTAVVDDNNGRSLKLVALPGFARPGSDPRAAEFEQKLKMLGRKWKAQHRGSSDWRDLYAEKYRPGVN